MTLFFLKLFPSHDPGSRMNPHREGFIEFIFLLVFILIIVFAISSAFKWIEDKRKQFKEEQGHVIGVISSIETTIEEPFIHSEGNIKFTTSVRERTLFKFEDGRVKKVIGVPKEPVPIGEEIAVTWTIYDILREVVDAEEYRSRK